MTTLGAGIPANPSAPRPASANAAPAESSGGTSSAAAPAAGPAAPAIAGDKGIKPAVGAASGLKLAAGGDAKPATLEQAQGRNLDSMKALVKEAQTTANPERVGAIQIELQEGQVRHQALQAMGDAVQNARESGDPVLQGQLEYLAQKAADPKTSSAELQSLIQIGEILNKARSAAK